MHLSAEKLPLLHIHDFVSWIVIYWWSCWVFLKCLETNCLISKTTPNCCFGISKTVFIMFYPIYCYVIQTSGVLCAGHSVTASHCSGIWWHVSLQILQCSHRAQCVPGLREVTHGLITGIRTSVRNQSEAGDCNVWQWQSPLQGSFGSWRIVREDLKQFQPSLFPFSNMEQTWGFSFVFSPNAQFRNVQVHFLLVLLQQA